MLTLLTLSTANADPYKEKAGAKDHPLVGRFQGSILHNYGLYSFERVNVPLSATTSEPVEGKVFNYLYITPKDKSSLEVFRNYKQSLEKNRFKILFACEDAPRCAEQGLIKNAEEWTSKPATFSGGYDSMSRFDNNGNYPPRFLAARLARPEGDVTALLTVLDPSSTQANKGAGGPYFLQIIEAGPMEIGSVKVNADALGKGLAAEGKIALYGILFDTGKAEIKAESKAQLDEMAKLLDQQKNLKVHIVGHTDNQGNLESNRALSQKRAEAITAVLIKSYKIDAKRLQSSGAASLSPVASNATETGRAKNRRVELVEQ